MHVVACAAPSGHLEPAPLTSLPAAAFGDGTDAVEAFWAEDTYYVCAQDRSAAGSATWFRIEPDVEAALAAAPAGAGVTATLVPRVNSDDGDGLVPFPLGSTGRTVFRVWRSRGGDQRGRTRILGVRAARSRRLPA